MEGILRDAVFLFRRDGHECNYHTTMFIISRSTSWCTSAQWRTLLQILRIILLFSSCYNVHYHTMNCGSASPSSLLFVFLSLQITSCVFSPSLPFFIMHYAFFFLVSLRPLSRSLQLVITYCTLHPLSSLRSVLIKNSPTLASPWLKSRSPELSDPRRLAGTLTPFHPSSLPPSPCPILCFSLSLSLARRVRSDAQPCCQREIADLTLAVTSPGYLQAVLLQNSDLPRTHTHTHTHTHTEMSTHTARIRTVTIAVLLLVQYTRRMHTYAVTFHPSNPPPRTNYPCANVSATQSGMPVTLSVNLSHIYMKLLTCKIYPPPSWLRPHWNAHSVPWTREWTQDVLLE